MSNRIYCCTSRFVSYLWGIETPPCRVCRQCYSGLYLTYEGLKQTISKIAFPLSYRLYLTYEGLKPPQWEHGTGTAERLYLTYEGLKRHTAFWWSPNPSVFVSYLWGIETPIFKNSSPIKILHCLYLTYEGLKLIINCMSQCYITTVCILPMRDWNFQIQHKRCQLSPVCILPMRDWNADDQKFWSEGLGFVSYLWGIETIRALAANPDKQDSFVSYLWGIETAHFDKFFDHRFCLYLTYEGLKLESLGLGCFGPAGFVSYLWGIETCFEPEPPGA